MFGAGGILDTATLKLRGGGFGLDIARGDPALAGFLSPPA